MEEICCTEHGAPCMLKTGTKPGPNLGKCFYLCSVLRDKCDFVKEAKNITSAACLKHPENIADLQHVTIGKVSGEKRHYYKCAQGVEKGQNWCGYVVMTSVGKVVPLGDSQKHNIEPRNVSTSVSVKKSVEDAESKMNQGSNFKNHNRHSGVPIPKLPKAVPKVADTSSGTQKESHEGKSSHGTTALDKDGQRDFTTSLAERIRNNSDSSPEIIEITSKASQGARPKMANFDFGSSVEEFSPPTYRSEIKVQSLACPPGNDAVIDKISRELKLKKQMMGTVNLSSLPDNGERLRQQVVDLENQLSNLNLQTSGSRSNTHSAPVPPPPPPPPPYNQGKNAPQIYTVYPSKPGSAPDHAKTIHVMHQQVTHKSQSVMKMDPPGVKTGQGMKQPVPPPPPPPPQPYNQGKNAPQVYTVYPTKPGSTPGETKTIHVMHQQATHKSQSVMKMDPPGVKTGQGMKQPILSFKTAAGAPVGTAKQSIVLNSAEPLPDHILKQMYGAKPQMMTLYGGRMTADRLKEVGTVTRDAIEDLHKQLDRRPAETEEADDPIGLNVSLMTHQRQALTWLMWREKQRPSGGILADDMGLGKTLTMISLIMKQFELNPSLKEVGKGGKGAKGGQDWMSKDKQLEKIDKNIVKSRATLVICPASLIHQWYKEIENRCEEGILRNVLLYHGPNREPNVFKLADNDVVLTTYNIVSKEVGEDADAKEAEKPVGDQEFFKGAKAKDMPNIARIAWERLILDEAHNIKNHKCKTAISVCRLRAGCRWALTGTPIQNDLIDMYSLLRFLRCSPFDEFQVWKRQVSMNVESGKARLNTLVKTFLLRRTKNQTGKGGKPLVPLPKKSVVVHDLKLSKDEKAVYDQVFAQSQSKFKEYLKRHTEKNGGKLEDVSISGNTGSSNPFMGRSSGGGKGASGGKDAKATGGTHILVSLLRLRQCCGHLSLLKSAIEDEVLETEGIELSLEEQMQGLMLSDSEAKPKGRKSVGGKKSPDKFDISKASSKIKAVMEEIEKVQKKSTKGKPLKSVVVSQWTKMLEIAAHHFDKAGIKCSLIQGNIPPQKRMETVEEFNKDPKGPTVLLLSLRAGGVGLNLIGGSNLFLLDQHWNPALEEQACDRIYRVGQTNDVFIHRFLCTDTVEEKIAELQRRKTDLANDVLSGSSASKKKLTLADLRMLFGV